MLILSQNNTQGINPDGIAIMNYGEYGDNEDRKYNLYVWYIGANQPTWYYGMRAKILHEDILEAVKRNG